MSLCVFLLSMAAAEPPVHEVVLDPGRTLSENFIGFGAEWDPRGYIEHGVTDDDFAVIARRVRYMRLPVARVMMLARWCYRGDGRFDWDSPEMQTLYRHLDLCQAENTTVLLTDWGCERDWVRVPGVADTADPEYARIIGVYLDHLLNTRGYTCIRYFILVNEPNYEVGDWDRWAQGARNVAAMLRERGLHPRIRLAGPDHSNDDAWLYRAVDELHDALDAYDVHRYAGDAEVRPGGLVEYFGKQWRYALANDPNAAGKPFIVGEAGMNDFARHPAGNEKIGEHFYGVFMADYAVQAARAGSHAVCAWMLCDNSHKGFFWGLWSNKADGMKLRPWFYPWSLLSRYVPRGSTVLDTADPSPDQRLLAARVPVAGDAAHGWTFVLVNRGEKPARVRVRCDESGQRLFRIYRYAEDAAWADADGFPRPVSEIECELRDGLTLECPGNAVVLATSLRIAD